MNDVNNPLHGPQGAAFVYAAQKGAGPEEIGVLDKGLQNLDAHVGRVLGLDNAQAPGAGAAGGAAYGLKCFLNAQFISGTKFLLDLANIPELIHSTKFDFIITGEGKIDSQTLSGKWINGVMELGRSSQIPVIAVCGILAVAAEDLKKAGLYDVIEVGDKEKSLEYNMTHAATLVEETVSLYFQKKEN